jgi:hypothetical protein
MILFIDPQIEDLVHTLRYGKPTKIIVQRFQDTPLAWSTPFLQKTQNSNEWKQYAKHPTDLTNQSAPYVTLMHSKFAWVWDALQDNPFKTDLFFWIDGGLTRFHSTLPYEYVEPHPRNLQILRNQKKLYAQIGGYKESFFQNFQQGRKYKPEDILGSNENIIIGGFWGGHVQAVQSLCEFGLRFYIRELIQKHRVENDQPTFFFHFQENPNLYKLVIPPPNLAVPIFLQFLFGLIQ